MTIISRYLTCAGREHHITEWGAGHQETIVCWHGLTRTGRDFDSLARYLSPHYRVICPDTLGRGLSQWAHDPVHEYSLDFYVNVVLDMCQQLNIRQMRWIGTSMGGLLGMMLAADVLKGRITHLVLNDIGPEIPTQARERITTYAVSPPEFETHIEFEQWARKTYAPFGSLTDEEWRSLSETSWRRTDSGKVTVHYDPRIGIDRGGVLDFWPLYDQIRCKTLLLRGATSDILTPEIADAMVLRGPRCQKIELESCGHAPMLNHFVQQGMIEEFLRS